MNDDNLLESIKSAITDGNYEEARTLLRVALKEPTAEIYYLASQVALNDQQRQIFLNKAKEIESLNSSAIIIPITRETGGGSHQGIADRKQGYLTTTKLILGGVIALIPLVFFLLSTANQPNLENRPPENEIQEPQSQSIPLHTPTETFTPEPINIARKEVFLRPSCEKTIRINSDQPIRIIYGLWASNGKPLAQETYSSVNANFSLNGSNYVGNKNNDIVPMNGIPCGTNLDGAYWIFYTIDFDILKPGEYSITVDFWFTTEITDGYDLNGDGKSDKYKNPFNQKYTLIVN